MVRRRSARPAIPREPRRRPVRPPGTGRRVLGATVASAAGVAVVALALGALAPLASVPSAAAGAPGQCEDERQLVTASSVLDRGADTVAGQLIACVDEEHRSLTIHNRTPIVWALSDPGISGVVSQTGGVSGLLSSYASRSGRGLILAPGASASVSAGPGRIEPQPDREGTRLFLALSAVVAAQDAAQSSSPPRAPRSVVRSAALTCALALTEAGYADMVDPAASERAAGAAACRAEWREAQVTALGDGWLLPGLTEALAAPGRPEEDAALARAADDWFAASGAFSWGGVDRPERR
ncbi:hypothetical protein SAMN06295885_2961 [Rathayibacter oskolensis]|uniref:Uncharacterized protein n=1 Tax=Rathayibacter oskolensis TaxID=1891671 RepID=A0A1X7P8I2_9MICO|nr:hypothetical protein [Rathayibacter oskolensis]SMH47364.1 hypothetical protein SAMN06295885_2961 [Rathayibacter oskolensis]